MLYSKRAIIEYLDEQTMRIRTDDGFLFEWKISTPPQNMTIGSEIVMSLQDKEGALQSKQELAECILSEIFNPPSK